MTDKTTGEVQVPYEQRDDLSDVKGDLAGEVMEQLKLHSQHGELVATVTSATPGIVPVPHMSFDVTADGGVWRGRKREDIRDSANPDMVWVRQDEYDAYCAQDTKPDGIATIQRAAKQVVVTVQEEPDQVLEFDSEPEAKAFAWGFSAGGNGYGAGHCAAYLLPEELPGLRANLKPAQRDAVIRKLQATGHDAFARLMELADD